MLGTSPRIVLVLSSTLTHNFLLLVPLFILPVSLDLQNAFVPLGISISLLMVLITFLSWDGMSKWENRRSRLKKDKK